MHILLAHNHTCTTVLAFALVGGALFFGDIAQAQSLQNPLAFDNISGFVEGALRALVFIGLPIISLFIVYSGFLFVMAQGNEDGLKKAKTNFLYVIIGAILILGAWALAQLLGGTVNQLRS